MQALQRAIAIAGSQEKLAVKIGKRQSYISMLLHRMKTQGRDIDPEICPLIEEATAGIVTRHDLRPDLWPLKKGAA